MPLRKAFTKQFQHLGFPREVGLFGVGLVTSFVVAFLCIRWLLRYIMRHDFTVFAWYRIVFGMVVLVTAQTGMVDWSVH